jgi:hypothetical protein
MGLPPGQHRANADDTDPVAVWLRQSLHYEFEMARKYERAARYPWLRLDPDPPRPNRDEIERQYRGPRWPIRWLNAAVLTLRQTRSR